MSPTLLLFSLLFLFLTTTTTTTSSTAAAAIKSSTEFIRTSCTSTLYPSLCFKSLARYANTIQQNPVHLALLATNVTLSRIRFLSSHISSLSSAASSSSSSAALHDCIACLGDAVDQVEKSTAEIAGLDSAVGEEVAWRVANVQTWMSAALTNEDTCSDGFAEAGAGGGGGHVKDDVCGRVRRVKEFTSNALALVNHLVAS